MYFEANKIDANGFIVDPVIVLPTDVLQSDIITNPVPEGLYKPKWTGTEWTEGATDEYKYSVDHPQKEPTEMEILKQENTLLKAQIQAATDRSDFHEELIAEMAMMFYP
ncbi:hypothetical protein LC048_20905 [Mesobacillus subterraneus]|uniref:hypothetical protein n=1 Tax=Mesobacillus subterraneus TaxID=285983 RepID=UPI001CFED6D6|nr:hypothetical protein [Mesobacillus subterraneus]WLR54828.1 hypothetical protein LC048_20905 [Mesobacillus subterraneus]